MAKILIIDDDRSVRLLVQRGLQSDSIQVFAAANAMEGLSLMETERPDVALVDIFLPEMNGLELFHKMRSLDRKLPIIFVTADNSSETTIEAMRIGAFDYLSKPLNLAQLRELTASALESRRLMDMPVAMPLTGESHPGERFIGRGAGMLDVFKSIGRVAAQNVTVLVRGESGSGKELVARAVVQHSHRKDKPFMAVNCAAIPDDLMESELFGHEKGAFTGAERRRVGKFEQCDGGSIFLDEVGDMSPLVQGKVLRLIQEQRFQRLGGNDELSTDVRIIAATNRPLEEMVERGEFREDLFYRLNGYTIFLPPLRDRREDIPILVEYFLRRAKREMGKDTVEGVSPSALDALVEYDWPGNVRQLQSVVRHAMLHTTGTVLTPDALPLFLKESNGSNERRAAAALLDASRTLQDEVRAQVPFHGPAGSPGAGPFPGNTNGSSSTGVPVPPAHVGPSFVGSSNPATFPPNNDLSHSTGSVAFGGRSIATNGFDSARTANSGATHAIEANGTLVNHSRPLDALTDFIEQRLSENSTNLYAECVEELERHLITRVLAATGGNQSKAAEILGITRGKVRDRIAAFQIQMDRMIVSASS